MSGERICITGAQGFLGRYATAAALAAGDATTVLGIGRRPRDDDAFPHLVRVGSAVGRAPLPASLRGTARSSRYAYASADVTQADRLVPILRGFAPTVVLHLASGLRDDDPADLDATNVAGTAALFAALARAKCRARVVIGSSGGVYGRPASLPLRETQHCKPADPYAASKLAQEHLALVLGRRHGVNVRVARLFNLIGPGTSERHAAARFASQVVHAVTAVGAPAIEVGDLTATRDFVDVRDAAAALLTIARRGVPYRAYNVASGVETSLAALLDLLWAAAGGEASPRTRRTYWRPGDIPRHVGDVARLRALGHRPVHTLAESAAVIVAYYRALASTIPEEARTNVRAVRT